MTIFERLAKLEPEKFTYKPKVFIYDCEFTIIDKQLTVLPDHMRDIERIGLYILIAEELGAKIWAEPTGWRHEQMWKGKYTTDYSWDTKPRATQHEAYLAALEAVIAEKENQ